jgi:hypothetical protein
VGQFYSAVYIFNLVKGVFYVSLLAAGFVFMFIFLLAVCGDRR